MSSNFSFELGGAPYTIPSPTENPIVYVATVVLFIVLAYALGDHGAKLPEINPLKPFEFSNSRRILEFYQTSKELMLKGRAKFGENPFRLMTEWGNVLVLPPTFIQELRSDPNLAFVEPARDDSHGYIPGFEPFDGDNSISRVVTKYLTKALTKLTKPLSEESTLVLRHVLSDSTEWHKISPQEDIMRIVSRLSTRVFAGEELCRNEDWVRVSSDYTAAAFGVGYEVGQWPRWSRPYVHWFLPACWRVRSLLAEARATLKPYIQRRDRIKAEALARGETKDVFDDAIEWFEKESPEKRDQATTQISLSLKTALYNLKLMDSVIKESQRMKPVLLSTWRRLVKKDITLSNGFVLRKGQKIIATNAHMWDANYYENPATYDGYRFLNMRGTDEEKNAHLVSTSAKHPGFGHGQHACPGRFFAANEVKIALAHLLLKYDWKFPDGFKPQSMPHGMVLLPDPSATLLIRRRKEELDLDSLEC
ncbi:hypothetical protein SGCOL_005527 [Colletotrichum sp. CLE4]